MMELYELNEEIRICYAIRIKENEKLNKYVKPYLKRPVEKPSKKPIMKYIVFSVPRRVVGKNFQGGSQNRKLLGQTCFSGMFFYDSVKSNRELLPVWMMTI
ncbi:MAG: hypothetical protein NC905_01745 [Candidatus Omnitrophica bacterium]|nr:hypothetical protein [Candidatus Omnitrophota bacterium]